jgi:hypothetical protein
MQSALRKLKKRSRDRTVVLLQGNEGRDEKKRSDGKERATEAPLGGQEAHGGRKKEPSMLAKRLDWDSRGQPVT